MAKKAIFDKKNILIIGGAGFVGSHLCDELVKENKIICIDDFTTGGDSNITHLYQNSNFKFINQNIINPFDLESLPEMGTFKIAFQGVQEIYFLASPTSPAAYSQHPIETLLVNSLGLRQALDLAVKYKAKFLYASSAAVYGDSREDKLTDEFFIGRINQLTARSCYAEAKRFGETLVNNYARVHNLDTKIVRIFNAYGPRLKLTDGRMIPEFIRSALTGTGIKIYGDQASTGSYLYISDLIKGLVTVMASGESGPLNLGSDWEVTFSDIAEKVMKLSGGKAEISFAERTEIMAEQLIPDISLVKERLGWFPIILLDEGLKETFEYLSAQQDVLSPGGNI